LKPLTQVGKNLMGHGDKGNVYLCITRGSNPPFFF
jgi:hypothetical protein